MSRRIVYFEAVGPDGDELCTFYGKVFGWDLQPMEGASSYFTVSADEAGVGGAVGEGSPGRPNYFAVYIEVPDIDSYLDKVVAAGGTVVVPRTAIPDVVAFAMFTDPAGNLVGISEAEAPPA